MRDIRRLQKKLTNIVSSTIQLCRFCDLRPKEVSKARPWNVLFFGTDDFSLESLKSLYVEYKLNILSRLEVVTSSKTRINVVMKYATEHGLLVHSWPIDTKLSDYDIGIVVSFGQLIPSHVINAFPLGMINIHASLLPKWRGAAPILYSLMNGDTRTGVSVMKIMPKKFDIGDVIVQAETTIDPNETLPELRDRLAKMGANLLIQTIKELPSVLARGKPQNDLDATYAPKITSNISSIKWDQMTAKNIYDLQRALTGLYPLTTKFQNMTLKLLDIQQVQRPRNGSQNIPGLVKFDRKSNLLIVQCKDETWITIGKIATPGRRFVTARDFNNGFIANNMQETVLFQ